MIIWFWILFYPLVDCELECCRWTFDTLRSTIQGLPSLFVWPVSSSQRYRLHSKSQILKLLPLKCKWILSVKKWLVNIDRYISWFYRMPATFRLWWRTDREGTGARRWTEVPRFWGWPTSWSPKRIYHTTTTLCCSLSKLTDDTYILALCAIKNFIPNFVKCTYWLWTNKEEIIINIHLLIIIIRDRKMRK